VGPRVSLEPAFSLAVPGVVANVEQNTSAEVVVAVQAPRAQPSWAGVLYGGVTSLTALAACLWAPIWIPEAGVAFIVPVLGVAVGVLAHHLSGSARDVSARRHRALNRARAAFVAEGVHRTRERTGVLLLIDEEEGRVEIVVDTGVEGALAMGRLAQVRFGGGTDGRDLTNLQAVLDGTRAMGLLLADALPATPDDNPDELDNTPRMLP